MCDRRPKPFWFRPLRQKGALHLHQVAPVHLQWHRSLYRSLHLAIAAAPLHFACLGLQPPHLRHLWLCPRWIASPWIQSSLCWTVSSRSSTSTSLPKASLLDLTWQSGFCTLHCAAVHPTSWPLTPADSGFWNLDWTEHCLVSEPYLFTLLAPARVPSGN